MRLGYGAWGEIMAEMVEAARSAEAGGFESVWTTELHRSPFVPAAAIASVTSRVTVGTAIAYAFVRSELTTALTSLDLDDLADGRFVLGLGSGVKRLITDWHNVEFGKPATHMRETVALVRMFVAKAHLGEDFDSTGEYHDIHVRNYERPFPPRRTEIPIYLAAMGPGMTRLAGEIGDGWLAHELGSPHFLRERVLPNLEEGIARSGRKPGDVTRVVSACCVPHSDSRQAKRWAAGLVAFYATVKTYTDFFAYHGFEKESLAVQEAFRNGDFDAMVDACPDEMVDTFTFAGTPDEILEGVKRYEGVADVIKLSPPTHYVPEEVTRLAQSATLELFAT